MFHRNPYHLPIQMLNPEVGAGALRQRLREAGLLSAFDEAVHTLDVSRVLEILREAGVPDAEAKRTAAPVLVGASTLEE
jgi:hypothetical protein